MKFKVIELPIIKTTDQGIVGAAVVGAKIITRYRENNIINVLKKHYSEYFSNDKLLFEVKIDADKKLFFSDQDTPSNQKRVFDMVGPNGPKEIKISNSSKEIRYLFLPTKISKDKSFWQEYFDFLQFL